MAFDLQIKPDFSGSGSELEKLVARAIGSNPVAAAAYAKKTLAFVDKAKTGALRITAARLRKRMLEAYETNVFGWPKHQQYSSFGGSGSVTIAYLVRANRPHAVMSTGKKAKSAMTTKELINLSKTAARAAKGSLAAAKKLGILQNPQPYPLGGRLPKATRYKVTKNSMTVGVLNDAKQTQKTKMQLFQDGRNRPIEESSRRYLAALGIFVRRGTILKSPFRKLIDPIQTQYPPDKLFESAFIDILTGKLEARD